MRGQNYLVASSCQLGHKVSEFRGYEKTAIDFEIPTETDLCSPQANMKPSNYFCCPHSAYIAPQYLKRLSCSVLKYIKNHHIYL